MLIFLVDYEMKKRLCIISAVDITFKLLLIAQIKAAQKSGFEVYGICSQGPNFDFLTQQGIKIFPVKIKRSISPFSDLKAFWQIYKILLKEKIDIVHTHTPKPSLIGQLAAKLAGVPVIINTVHGFYFHDNMKPLPKFFFSAMEWIAGKCSTIILSQNPEDIKTAIKLNICKPEKIKLLGNGVNLEKFDPERFNKNFKLQKRREIDVPDDAIVIGIIGRLVLEKGFLELFKAFKNVITEKENVWLVIIGPEEPEKTYRISADTFKEYGIKERIVYLGSRDDIAEILSCIDIFTLPSWREGFPRSAIEASAMGLPVVATNIRGCRQVVEDGKTGFLTTLFSVEELEKALLRLITDEKLRLVLGRRGYEKSRREFDESKVCRIVIDTYIKFLQEIFPEKNFNRKTIPTENNDG